MKVAELIKEINQYVEQLDFVTARKLIEVNLEVLNKNRLLLNSNARELLKIFTDQYESGFKPISKQDLATLVAINTYATNFDLRSIKFLVKDKAKLLLRHDVVEYLNKDAKVILEGMGIITKGEVGVSGIR